MTTPKTLTTGSVTEDFIDELEDKLDIKTTYIDRDGECKYDVQNIEEAFKDLDCVIFGIDLIDDDDRVWYEESVIKLLALDNSFKDGKANIVPVTFSSDAKIPPSLSHLECLEYANSDAFWDSLRKRIFEPKSLTDKTVLPVGNVAHGLVHNYFRGYLMRILRTTSNSPSYIELYESGLGEIRTKYGPVMSLNKLVILLPKNCTCKATLNEYDNNIEYLENFPISKLHDRAGQQKVMLNAVYKILHNGKTYVLLLEVPNIITTISKLLRTEGVEFSVEQLHIQFENFKFFLKEALDFQEDLQHAYHIIEFDECDANLKLGELIASEVDNLLMQPESPNSKPNVCQYDVNIVAECDQIDYEAASIDGNAELIGIVQKLKSDGIKVCTPQDRTPGRSEPESMTKEIQRSRKTLLWLTENLNERQEHVYYEAHWVQEYQKRGLLLPVVKGDTFPQSNDYSYLKAVNHLYSSEPDFYQKLVNAIKGETPLTYPLGDIATGLVWTYCLNYLEPNLKEFVDGYNQKLSEDKESVKFPKFICLLPKSCYAPGKVIDYDPKIEYNTESYHEEFTVTKMISGKARHFNKQINRITHNGKTYKVMIEFATPLAAIAETEIGMKTQLSTKHKHEQREIFNELLKVVVSNGKKNSTPLQHCELLEFDDEFEDQTKKKKVPTATLR